MKFVMDIGMMRVKKFFSFAILLFATQVVAQTNCLLFDMTAREPVFQSGERITYTLSYTVMGVWTNVGEVVFNTTLREEGTRRPHYQIDAVGKTFAFFDKIFKVRDHFVTRIDAKTFQPFYMHRTIHEGSYKLKSTGHFNRANSAIYATTQRLDKERPERRDTLPLTPCTFDMVSLFYYYRNADFSKMKEKTMYDVELALDDKVYVINYKLLGREEQRVKGVG
ncbi:MAG: DUF3108 domain-containing protein, partial [Bacteroidales bacterium]|nr:DUF3108 domain-containing protein [Bacteroidales bacterium]